MNAEGVGRRELFGGFRAAMAVFELAGCQAAVAHDHAVRNADELGIRELDARPLVAIVEQHVVLPRPGVRHRGVQRFHWTRCDFGALMRDHDHLEGRNGVRPDDAARIMVLLDGRGNDACHTDAVAAHVQGGRLAGFVEHGGAHGLAVFPAELEDVAHLDAARDRQFALAGRRGVAGARRCGCRRRSASGRSRTQFTPVKCASFLLAPQTKSASATTAWSA